ncbi:MAG: hypothetical protein K2Y42_08200 [Hyphomicrobium sp.]|jgi:hypothetical protein|uniref:hypothetical protein n=1 Tax=Hyphomicrobium sp. TaxID=82 RepID=UPI0025C1AAD4|nr:hypothetical protein [Hyphomicrobium sp.]MBX9862721.1 hypothetical protein [Hyphomicrobium sp.]
MTKIQNILAASITLGALLVSSQAGAVSLGVKLACAADYHAHCSMHAPDSPGVRKCMRAVGRNLSQGCISALVAAGEVSKSTVERKVATK